RRRYPTGTGRPGGLAPLAGHPPALALSGAAPHPLPLPVGQGVPQASPANPAFGTHGLGHARGCPGDRVADLRGHPPPRCPGVALDAAARGLRTGLVDRADLASGTSSKSSKLVHGGLRYLQQREYLLVYENLAERQLLLHNAPHLVAPLPFLIPLFGKDGVLNKAVARAYSVALWLYDLTGGLRIGKRHRR